MPNLSPPATAAVVDPPGRRDDELASEVADAVRRYRAAARQGPEPIQAILLRVLHQVLLARLKAKAAPAPSWQRVATQEFFAAVLS